MKCREEARALAIARNKLLEEATQAYLRYISVTFLTYGFQGGKRYRQKTLPRRSRSQSADEIVSQTGRFFINIFAHPIRPL